MGQACQRKLALQDDFAPFDNFQCSGRGAQCILQSSFEQPHNLIIR
jgi:hypothetical protein